MPNSDNYHPYLLLFSVTGGILNEAKAARKIASVLLESRYGKMVRGPFMVRDGGDRWIVETESKIAGESAMIALAKEDARVVDIYVPFPLPLRPALDEDGNEI